MVNNTGSSRKHLAPNIDEVKTSHRSQKETTSTSKVASKVKVKKSLEVDLKTEIKPKRKYIKKANAYLVDDETSSTDIKKDEPDLAKIIKAGAKTSIRREKDDETLNPGDGSIRCAFDSFSSRPTVAYDEKEDKLNIEKKMVTVIPWAEKYRPRRLNDIVLEQNTYNKIKKIITDKEMPNIIITGVPGIGKTTTILCIARFLLRHYMQEGVLELNASDDRGIKAVQDSIIYFCKKRMTIPEDPDKSYAKHKIVLLDEADNMTKKAQQLVNNLMEKYHSTTRFAFTCNNSSEIIEAIQSRCIILRYSRLSRPQVTLRLQQICQMEDVNYDKSGIDAIVTTACGDMRQAINNLQLAYTGYGIVTEETVYKLCDKPHPDILKTIFISCYNHDLIGALNQLERKQGYSSADITMSMINTFKTTNINEIDEETKIKFLIEIHRTAHIISRGLDTPLQLTGCIANICNA
jgi:replication factor C subunit 2/4